MEPRKRIHLVNELMQEANLMMTALEKAMQGKRMEESAPVKHGTHHSPRQYSLEDEHKDWGSILRALTDIQAKLEQIEHAEQERIEQRMPSPYATAKDGVDTEDYTRV